MISEYYYLVASLPSLDFGIEPPISSDEFLNRCREQLSDTHLGIIERVTIEPASIKEYSGGILKKWQEFDTALRNELVKMRAVKKEKEASDYIRSEYFADLSLTHYAHIIYNQGSPLEAERTFDRIRWDKIEDLKLGHYFDIDFLVAYLLQLQILERWKRFSHYKGSQILEELTGKL